MYGDDLGLGIGTIRATDRGQTQSDSNPREADLTQIFIKAPERRHYCLRLWRGSIIHDLWNKIHNLLGIPEQGQNLIYMGCSLQDNYTLQNYIITTYLTIIINLRLRGGCSGTSSKNTSSKNTGSFKDAVKSKGKAQSNPATAPVLPRLYIVEQKTENPAFTIAMPEVNDLYSYLYSHLVICRFNGYWPRSGDLHHWIHTT